MRALSLSQFGLTVTAIALMASPATALKPAKAGRLVNPLFFSAPECGERPEFLTENRTPVSGGFAALPKTVLVARDAEMWVEGAAEGTPVRMHTYQSFVKPKTRSLGRVLCGSTPSNFSDRFSLVAPTLIDASAKRDVGNSMWQFQVIADNKGYSVWNKKSPSLSKASALDEILRDQKSEYRLYQLNHNEYELVIQKDIAGVTQTLSVRYEALR